jgi:hypothetical protein
MVHGFGIKQLIIMKKFIYLIILLLLVKNIMAQNYKPQVSVGYAHSNVKYFSEGIRSYFSSRPGFYLSCRYPIYSNKLDLSLKFQKQSFQDVSKVNTKICNISSVQTAIYKPILTRKFINIGCSLANNFTLRSTTSNKLEPNGNNNKQIGLNFGYYGQKTEEYLLFNPKVGLNMQIKFKKIAVEIERDIALTPAAKFSGDINRSLYIPSLRTGISYYFY